MLVSVCVRPCHADDLLSLGQGRLRDELCRRGPLPFSPGALAPRGDIQKTTNPNDTSYLSILIKPVSARRRW